MAKRGSMIANAVVDVIDVGGKKTVKKVNVPATKPTAGAKKPHGTRKPRRAPHQTTTTVTRNGESLPPMTHTSGNMTPEQKAMGFPKGSLDSHTEAKAMRDLPGNLGKGDHVTVEGQYKPCPIVKGK